VYGTLWWTADQQNSITGDIYPQLFTWMLTWYDFIYIFSALPQPDSPLSLQGILYQHCQLHSHAKLTLMFVIVQCQITWYTSASFHSSMTEHCQVVI